ncbi:P-loop containing nucleoside triphosphate hydrolase protein [Kickxella alabastrina]|uniref:P-loop containing nucleoside triphosphate hydrolase protein n=1 Tax=Kickxella alabastrina TaxID=61397 RepID=UPI0022206F00|nr:P-loop containing nucleoside triphosphate hydrolase protein [Kickxella alabastrina]KAI7828482.1 P-loop containing nucleoside triphosphate hydrolase protein [Kickxella alabastrina]
MEGSDNSSTAEQPTQHSEDEPVPDGLQRFPDFSQEATISSSAAQEAARMGIPQWLAQPTTVDRDVTAPANDPRFGLSGHILGQCSKAGIDQLFAVQSAVIPVLRAAHSLSRLRQHVRDVCVSAPTGSGKTLAFVIPIVEKLRARVVVRLRALVVLPTKELAQQVKESFDFFCVGTDLRVGLATGDMSLGKEQAALVVGGSGSAASGGSSRVDILVCTPGRLLDHLAMTRGFTLQHLEFWVMDEADRLLGEAYQEWLPKVQAAIEAEAEPEAEAGTGLGEHGVPTADACTRRSALARLDPLAPPAPRVQKLLFSATLTRDPGKIARLKLVRPLYVAVTQPQADSQADGTARYAFPASLREFYAMCAADEKPLWLMWLLWTEGVRHGVCFTKSLETAHRLAQVMQAWAAAVTDWPEGRPAVVVAEYSSDLAAGERARIMRMFRAGEISMLICSDLIARGMDVDQISAVVNYDVPVHMSQYTHRVGRTARAGREGAAYTLVGSAQAFHFKKMMKENGHWDGVLRRVDPAKDVLEGLRGQYKAALERVGEIYGEIN